MSSSLLVGARALGISLLMVGLGVTQAEASGPVERLFQVAVHPKEPSVVVLRYGAASEGLLFSRDGGRSFRALCSNVIGPKVDRLAGTSPYRSAVVIDGAGRVVVNTFDGVWSDDGTGCTWTAQSGFGERWVAATALDPRDPGVMYAVTNLSTGEGDDIEARPELLRRSASGEWVPAGTLKAHVARQRAYVADLVAVPTPAGTRLYASLATSVGALDEPQKTSVVVSDDEGKTWREQPALPDSQERLSLVAADPTQPDRLLAVDARTEDPDTLFVSEDQGRTFKVWRKIQDLSGVAFGREGRVFVGDAGDGSRATSDSEGGIWTAAKVGDALAKILTQDVGAPEDVDCLGYDAQTDKLQVCKLNRYGTMDWKTGIFEELTQFEAIQGLLECPNDTNAICEPQLNSGAAWCCVGHFPFTPFCEQYDVTRMNGRPVACGRTGRAAEIEAGRGPSIPTTPSGGAASSFEETGVVESSEPSTMQSL